MRLMRKYLLVSFFLFVCGCCRPIEQDYNLALKDKAFLEILEELDILLIAPSSGIPKQELDTLKSLLGNRVRFLPDEHYDTCRQSATKLDEIIKAINSAKILWAVRGGYGATKLASVLSKKYKSAQFPKIILVGYSDITALHIFMKERLFCVHAPMARELLFKEYDVAGFKMLADVLSGRIKCIKIDLRPLNESAKAASEISGLLIGGNLSLVESSIGTDWQAECKGKIVFLEDVGCNKGQAMRTLTHLLDSGILDKAKTVIFGSFSKDGNAEFLPIFKDFADTFGRPVFLTDKFGHGHCNYPIGYGVNGCVKRYNGTSNAFMLYVDFSETPIFKKKPPCKKS
jgi:muramoyltetrapeptide carboxypeptidase